MVRVVAALHASNTTFQHQPDTPHAHILASVSVAAGVLGCSSDLPGTQRLGASRLSLCSAFAGYGKVPSCDAISGSVCPQPACRAAPALCTIKSYSVCSSFDDGLGAPDHDCSSDCGSRQIASRFQAQSPAAQCHTARIIFSRRSVFVVCAQRFSSVLALITMTVGCDIPAHQNVSACPTDQCCISDVNKQVCRISSLYTESRRYSAAQIAARPVSTARWRSARSSCAYAPAPRAPIVCAHQTIIHADGRQRICQSIVSALRMG